MDTETGGGTSSTSLCAPSPSVGPIARERSLAGAPKSGAVRSGCRWSCEACGILSLVAVVGVGTLGVTFPLREEVLQQVKMINGCQTQRGVTHITFAMASGARRFGIFASSAVTVLEGPFLRLRDCAEPTTISGSIVPSMTGCADFFLLFFNQSGTGVGWLVSEVLSKRRL